LNKQGDAFLVGRSLREVEKREAQAEREAGAAWFITLVATLLMVILAEFFHSDNKKNK